MKVKNLMMLALVACSMTMTVSCGKDTPEPTPTPQPQPKPQPKPQPQPQPKPDNTVKGKKTIDATSYADWTYINLETGETEVHRDFSEWVYLKNMHRDSVVSRVPAKGSEADVKIKWHIAIHRFDIKTNDGEAVATTATELDKVTTLPTTGYKPDTLVKMRVITDMSKMRQSLVGCAAESHLNAPLAGWLIRTPTGTMPPYTYKLSNKVYVVKFKNGSHAKLKFTDYTDATGKINAHVTFSYEYKAK